MDGMKYSGSTVSIAEAVLMSHKSEGLLENGPVGHFKQFHNVSKIDLLIFRASGGITHWDLSCFKTSCSDFLSG